MSTKEGIEPFGLRLGDLMRGERAVKGKTLLDVQAELKIAAAAIAAIENLDLKGFQGPEFVHGHVKSYAKYLGMDPGWAWETFCRESNFKAPQSFDDMNAEPLLGQSARQVSLAEFQLGKLPESRQGVRIDLYPSKDRRAWKGQSAQEGNYWSLLSALAGLATFVLILLSDLSYLESVPLLKILAALIFGAIVALLANWFHPKYFFARAVYIFFAPVATSSIFGVTIDLRLSGDYFGGLLRLGNDLSPVSIIVCGFLTALALILHYGSKSR